LGLPSLSTSAYSLPSLASGWSNDNGTSVDCK
jgi:hypothetical protein